MTSDILSDVELYTLLIGPLSCPSPREEITRLGGALRCLLNVGGAPAAEALRRYCAEVSKNDLKQGF